MNFAYLLDAFFTLVYNPLTFLLNISTQHFYPVIFLKGPLKIFVFFRVPLRSGGTQQASNNNSDTKEHGQL